MTQEAQAVLIETVEQMAFAVGDWHRNTVHHLLAIVEKPEALGLKQEKDGVEVELSARETECFALGVEYALSLFKDLPFVPKMEEVANEADSENPGDGSIV